MAGVFAFIFMQGMSTIQEAFNPMLQNSSWSDNDVFTSFFYAASFLTNMWTYIIGFVVFILIYWSYIYSQRRSNLE